MKRTIVLGAGTAAIALLTLATDSLRAGSTNYVTIHATMLLQGSTNEVRDVDTVASPKEYEVDTKQILAWAAQDEYAEGKYGSTTFPAGAQLVEIDDPQTGWSYQVVDGHNQFLADVSDVVSSGSSSNSVYCGKINTATGVDVATVTAWRLHQFAYNDSAIVAIPTLAEKRQTAGVNFYLRGLETRSFKDATPNSAGNYTEKYEGQVSNGVGEGVWGALPVIVEGEFEYTATLELHIQ